jgi:RNA polymerase sigma-70 factor (ECF subfamily)
VNFERELHEDFEAFYRANLDVVLAFCFARTGDAELAADLAAESFAAALAARDRYSPRLGSARQWLLGIAAHKTIDALRRGHVERRAQQQLGVSQITWSEDDLDYVTHVDPRPLERVLAELPDDQRQAIQAHVLDELGYGEIARVTGVSEQAMRKRVSRGLAALRRQLTKEPR